MPGIKDMIAEDKKANESEFDLFEHAGIDIPSLRNKWVRLNVGKMKIEGKVISVNEQYGLLKIRGNDHYVSIIRLGKVSMISVRD